MKKTTIATTVKSYQNKMARKHAAQKKRQLKKLVNRIRRIAHSKGILYIPSNVSELHIYRSNNKGFIDNQFKNLVTFNGSLTLEEVVAAFEAEGYKKQPQTNIDGQITYTLSI